MRLQKGSMEVERDPLPAPNPFQTTQGISLQSTENPSLFEQLGEDLLLFTECCQNRCAWRRRSYLVVVNELTRLIHKEFSEAQIEVGFLPLSLVALRVFANRSDAAIIRCGYRHRGQREHIG